MELDRSGGPSRSLSFAWGLVIAAVSVLLSHLVVHGFVYGEGDAPTFRFFYMPGIPAGIFVVISLLILVVVRVRRGRTSTISKGRTLVWALVATLVLNIAPLLSMAWPERGNEYFGFALYAMGVMTTPVAIVLALILTALIIAGYHYIARRKAVRSPSQRY